MEGGFGIKVAAAATAGVACVYCWLRSLTETPEIATEGKHSQQMQQLLEKCPSRHSYTPTWWMVNRHFMTIISTKRSHVPTRYEREEVRMDDGGHMCLDWLHPEGKPRAVAHVHAPGSVVYEEVGNPPPMEAEPKHFTGPTGDIPVMVFMHGVTGGSNENYITHMAKQYTDLGWRCVVINQRGSGTTKISSPLGYNAGAIEDCMHQLNKIREYYQDSKIYCTGVSMGSNILLRALGKAESEGVTGILDGCVSMGNPMDTLAVGKGLNRGFAWASYSLHLGSRLRQYALRNFDQLAANKDIDINNVKKIKSVWDFDSYFTAPMFGYKDATHYYSSVASLDQIGHIRTPTLCLACYSDPLCPGDGKYAASASPEVAMITTQNGGHVAWFEGLWPMNKVSWGEKLALEFVLAVHERNTSGKKND